MQVWESGCETEDKKPSAVSEAEEETTTDAAQPAEAVDDTEV